MDVFGGAPRFLAYPRPVVVQSGTDAVLKCQIGGDPRPAVIWESNNIKIDTQGRYRVFEDGNVYNLIISSVTSEDSGQYICKAKNSIGETYAAATLKVEGEAQELEVREENKPRFLIKPLSTRVGRGDDAVFSCKLWGNPRPDVVWEKDGRKLHEIFESTHFSVGCQDGGWFQLKIFKTRAPDGGVYTCKARNEFGEGLAGAVLLVDAGPGQGDDGNRNGYNNSHWKAQQGKQRSGRLMSNRLRDDGMTKSTKVKMFAVTEGKHAKFRCFVTGKPKPEIIWRKDGRLILSGRRYLCYEDREGYFTLKVLYCKQKDNGVYVCAASNTAGQTLSAVHLTVKEPPVRFKQPLIDLEVWERDLAVLECEVPEDSVPITWYLEDRRLQPGAKYGMEEWGTKRRLTIRDIGVDDDGIYLCEMPDGGRSIAEVAVKGTIVRKLPRKVDVLEGENAAFCVEVEEEEMDIHWYKEGVELRETHQTILKSFGRTHILVFVNTNPQDSGLVMFFVGRSKTSSQLRVKAAKHSPPSCPVSVQINTERANAALLSWVPAQDSRKNPPSGYVLERQEVGTGSQEWLQCLTTDSATSVEILGDSVPCEADYRFRICSVNKYGKSNNVEFPRAVHLVPVARIQAPLQDALVPEGQDACFTIELSASVIGTWFLNGTQLQDDERYTTRRSRTHQSLRIRGVRETDNGAEITFIAYSIRDSAALYIQAPLVKFSPLSEMDRNKFIEEGNPIVLYCELSDPAAPVHWYKNGVELQTTEGLHIQSEGTMRRIVIQSAEFSHSGVYCCDAIDDVIRFNVEVEAPPVKFTPLPDEKRERAIHTGSRMELQCELSDLSATVHWYKDGSKLLPQSGVEMLSDGLSRMLVVDVADFIHSGLYSCKTKGDAITFNVDVTVPPVKFSAIPEPLRNKTIEAGCPIVLQCVVSDPEAQVCWYKGPTQLLSNAEIEIQSEGHTRSLVIQFAEPGHSGVYSCASEDDTMEFRVEIRAIPVKFSTSFDVEQTKAFEVGAAFELECEVTEPTAEVCWYKDGHQLCPQNGWDINSDSSFRRLIVQSAELFHAGRYSCETSDDTIQFTVDVKAPMLPLLSSPEVEESNLIEVTCPLELQGQWSDSAVPVLGPQDEEQDQTSQPGFETGGFKQTLVIEPTHSSKSGAYYCATADDVAKLIVQNEALPVTCPPGSAVEKTKPIEAQSPIVRQFEISDPVAKACWYKDGTQIYPQNNSQSETAKQTMFLPSDGLFCEKKSGCERKAEVQFNVDKKAYQCHSGDDSVAVSDESHESTMDTKAIPPRHSPDQATEPRKSIEVANSTEDETILQKPNSWVSRKIGEPCKYIKHSGPTPALNPTSQGYDEQIPVCSEVPSSSRQATTVDDVDCPESTYAVMVGSGANQHCIQTTEVQIENLRRNTQYSPAPLENVTTSTHTVTVQAHKYCAALQTATVQAEEPDSAQECTAFKSQEICKSSKMKYIQSKKLCRSSKTEKLQSVGLSKCFQAETIQSEGVSRGLQAEKRQSHGLSSCLQAETIQSVGLSQCLAAETIQSQGLSSCFQVETVESVGVSSCFETESHQLVEQSSCLQAETVQSVGLSSCSKTEGHKSVELSGSLQTQTIQEKENSKQIATVLSDGLSGCLQTKTLQLNDPCDSIKSATVQSEEVSNSFSSTVQSAPPVRIKAAVCETERNQSCEVSDPCAGVSWYKDGLKLLDLNGQAMGGSEGSVRSLSVESALPYHAAPPVKFSAMSEADQTQTVMVGCPIALLCELSDPTGQVHWSKDGAKLIPPSGVDIQSDGNIRKLTIQSAQRSHSGVYQCETKDDAIQFSVDVKALPLKFCELPEDERSKSVKEGSPLVLRCELCQDTTAEVFWSRDGTQLLPGDIDIQSDGLVKKLCIHSVDRTHAGIYQCSTAGDSITITVEIKGCSQRIKPIPMSEKFKALSVGSPVVLQCELQDPVAQVSWCKDGVELYSKTGLDMKRNGHVRKLVINSAKASDSGLYSCCLSLDVVTFQVEVQDPAAEVNRYKDVVQPLPLSNFDVQSNDELRSMNIQSAEARHRGLYSCEEMNDIHIESKVDVAVHPVTFVNSPEEERFKSVVEQDQLVLACEVSQADAPVQWYMDGVELQACDNVTMRSADTARTLSIRSARLSDTGTYTCRAGDSALIFKVNIREPPVTIVYPKEDVHLDRHVPEEIILSCELSRPNGVVNWYKDGQKLQESENIKLKVEGPYRRLKLICSRVEDSGEYVCDTADDSIFFHLKITEPPVRIVSPSQSQMELCQQTSERMVLSCEISRANALVRWYRDGLEVEENKNLILEVDGIYRRLIIPETSVQDSAEYVCDTADDSVTFFVNIAEPPVRFMRPRKMASVVERFAGEAMVLDCEVSRANAEVTWKRNGEEVEDSRKVTILEDVVLRQLTVHCLSLEDAGQYICDAKDDVMDFQVKVKELPVRILGKTDATAEKKFLVSDDIILVCELSQANASVSWYKDSVLIDNDTRFCCEEQGAFRSLVVLSAELEDSGEYSCDAGDDKMLFCITVKEPPVQIIGNSGTPEQHILVAGDDLILECEVSRPNCPVQWLWNSKLLKSDDRIKIDSCDVVRRLVLSGLQPSDSGKYICDAIDDKMITLVEVQQPPVKFVNKQPNNNISACENECVSLCAIVSQERANVRWLKDGRLLNEDNVHISIDGANHNLTINPLKLSNAGVYVCDANTDEMSFTVIVKEMKATFSLPLENITGLKGSMLTLRCELSKPKGDVQWLKNGQEISPSRRHTIRAQGRERSFAIHQLADEDAGEYTCESTDDRTSTVVTVETPRTVEFIAELHNITVREGEDATFKCVVSPEDTHLTWCLNGERVHQDDRLTVISNGLCHTLCIKKCRVSDSARVTADAEGLAVSQANLQVQEQQVLFTKSMAPLTAEEFGEATLEVEVSLDSGEVQWMRQGVLLHPGAKYSLKRKGRKHTLTVHKLAVADRGIYSCESLHDRTQAQLTVEPRKVTINTGLKDIRTTERETASFEVVLSHADVPGSWLRNGVQLKPTKHWRISTKGHVHSLTVSNLAVEDTGSFSFCVENLRTSARLVVREPPVTFLRHLDDQKFPEGSVVSIECELSRHNVDVRWMKNGAEVKPGKDQRIFAMGRKRFLQIMKGVVGDSAQYTCDAADTSTSCTIEIYEREVLVVQGLQDQDIQEDQNAVFVCDLSVEDVPGEWYRNGDRIQPTSSIKIRQEGTKHFLLMVNVRGEDSGEIKFVARHVESVASLKVEELPVNIVNPLQDQTAVERSRVLLDCTVSNPRCSIRWYKGPTVILPSERFEICSEGCYRKLIIQPVELRDQGTYSVQVGEYSCSAHLTVEAQSVVMVRPLEDVEVGAPGDACFPV
uniref:Obscurin like cytoskeletal adaptor 1b n=1 Tax=Gadus morhua TaxID=8049 RepID=A0A8C4Z849_GADMO